jgi:predicted Zn-dependent protease
LSLLFGDVSGGAVLGLASNQLMSARYTREAEAAADRFAFRLMDQSGIGTAGLAAFFDRIDAVDGEMPDYLATHPDSGNRAQAARDADTGVREPALTEAEWRDLKGICG